jgi:hypothetical protein
MLESRALLADGISPTPAPALHAVAGIPLSNAVFATYTVTDASSGSGAQWRGLINFGDGQVDGPLVPAEKGAGFAFIDTHTYSKPGTYTVTVMIAIPGSHMPNDNTVTTTVTVSASSTTPTSPGPTPTSPPPPIATGIRLRTGANRPFLGPVARLSGLQAGVHQLAALIDWGDDSPPAAGLIRSRGHGHFQVIGSHSYALPGKYTVLVTIRDPDGPLLAESTAIVRARR